MPWARPPPPTRWLELGPPASASRVREVLHTHVIWDCLGGGETPSLADLTAGASCLHPIPGILRVKRKYSKHYYLILTLRENNFSEDYNCHRSLKSFRLPDWVKLEWQSIFLMEGMRFPETCIAFSWFYLTTDKWNSCSQKVDVARMWERLSVLTVFSPARTCWVRWPAAQPSPKCE